MSRTLDIQSDCFRPPQRGTTYRTIADAVNAMCSSARCSDADTRYVGTVRVSCAGKSHVIVFMHEDNGKYANILSEQARHNIPAGMFLLERFDHTEPDQRRPTFIKLDGVYRYLGVYRYVAKFRIDDGDGERSAYALWQREDDRCSCGGTRTRE